MQLNDETRRIGGIHAMGNGFAGDIKAATCTGCSAALRQDPLKRDVEKGNLILNLILK